MCSPVLGVQGELDVEVVDALGEDDVRLAPRDRDLRRTGGLGHIRLLVEAIDGNIRVL